MSSQTLEKPVELLLAKDRCDRCGAQAYLAANKDDMELLFCYHHANEHEATLVASGWEIHDERTRLYS